MIIDITNGTLEVDEDSKAGTAWEKEAGVSLDTMTKRLARPEGFLWSCCWDDGRTPGCMVTKHRKKRSDNYHAKLARFGFQHWNINNGG